MRILNCPVCGKQPKIKSDNGISGAWTTIQCKPFLRKPHLKIIEGKASIERCYKYAIARWNKEVNKFKNNIGE